MSKTVAAYIISSLTILAGIIASPWRPATIPVTCVAFVIWFLCWIGIAKEFKKNYEGLDLDL